MHPSVATALPEITMLCRRVGVRRLDLFGSATGDSFDPLTSDVDVLVEFGLSAGTQRFDTYFMLKEGLERILGRPVDLVERTGVRNPYVMAQIQSESEQLYAA